MAVTNYYSMDGMIFAESTNGVMRNYGTDALGSVVETIVNGAVENTYQYKPFGGLLAKTGTAPDPSFLWNGGSGYRATKLPDSDYYVRNRIFSSVSALWTTTDQLWPREAPYTYVRSSPTLRTDPTGTTCQSATQPSCCTKMDWTAFGHCKGGRWEDCPSPVGLASRCMSSFGQINCADVKNYVTNLAKTCVDACDGGTYPPDADWFAATRCCLNHVNPPCCIGCTKCCSKHSTGTGSALKICDDYCLLVHEQTHQAQCDVSGTPCKLPPNSECCAFQASARCLFTMFLNYCFGGYPIDYGQIPELTSCMNKASANGCNSKTPK